MRTLLRIDSSPRGERSHSRRLTEYYNAIWKESHPDGLVIHRDLGLAPVPMVTEDWIAGAFAPIEVRTPEQSRAIAVSDELIDEVFAADEILIGAPMYNFAITASLKAWIDQIVRVGRTIDAMTYQGLVIGRPVTVLSSRGWDEMEPGQAYEARDAQVPYLRQILGFIGVTDVRVIYASGLAGAAGLRDASVERAMGVVRDLAGAR